jgi:hypothetical protein
LYFAFLADKASTVYQVSFESFVKRFPSKLLQQLTPQVAIEVITLYQEERYGHKNGVIFLAVDDIDHLLDNNHVTDQHSSLGFLMGTMAALDGAVHNGEVFVFPVVTGSAVLPINAAIRHYGSYAEPLPIALFSRADKEAIIDRMAQSNDGWSGWRDCRPFRMLLANFADLPLTAVELLNLVGKELQRGIPLRDVDYQRIYQKLTDNSTTAKPYSSTTLLPLSLATTILADVLTEYPVLRQQYVPVTQEGTTWVDGPKYGDLEAQSIIVLATRANWSTVVQLTFPMFQLIVRSILKDAARWSEDPFQSTDGDDGWLVPAEDFHCHVEAIRKLFKLHRYRHNVRAALQKYTSIRLRAKLTRTHDALTGK